MIAQIKFKDNTHSMQDWQKKTQLIANWLQTEQGKRFTLMQYQQITLQLARVTAASAKKILIACNYFAEPNFDAGFETCISVSGYQHSGVQVVASPTAMPFADNSCDAVIMNYVCETLANPADAIAESYRILKPEGVVIVVGFCENSILRWQARAEQPFSELNFNNLDFYQRHFFLYGYDLLDCHKFSFGNLKKENKIIIEWCGKFLWPFLANAFIISARKRVESLTPLKLEPSWSPMMAVKNPRLANLVSDCKVGKS
jgi:SAM-dependent methyltransferase